MSIRPHLLEYIAALGHLEPKGEVTNLSATPSSDSIGLKVAQLLVSEDDCVRSQQVIAIFDHRDRLLAAWQQARQQVQVANANLKS